MTDLTPNDLSHLSDDEFNALCPHDGHAPGPEPLSPAAQVMIAVTHIYQEHGGEPPARAVAAAALRAAADQVVPEERKPSADSDYHLMNWTKALDTYYQRKQTRAEILAIATELEAH